MPAFIPLLNHNNATTTTQMQTSIIMSSCFLSLSLYLYQQKTTLILYAMTNEQFLTYIRQFFFNELKCPSIRHTLRAHVELN